MRRGRKVFSSSLCFGSRSSFVQNFFSLFFEAIELAAAAAAKKEALRLKKLAERFFLSFILPNLEVERVSYLSFFSHKSPSVAGLPSVGLPLKGSFSWTTFFFKWHSLQTVLTA